MFDGFLNTKGNFSEQLLETYVRYFNCIPQMRIQNPVEQRWIFYKSSSAVNYILPKAPSWMFNWVLNTPLYSVDLTDASPTMNLWI